LSRTLRYHQCLGHRTSIPVFSVARSLLPNHRSRAEECCLPPHANATVPSYDTWAGNDPLESRSIDTVVSKNRPLRPARKLTPLFLRWRRGRKVVESSFVQRNSESIRPDAPKNDESGIRNDEPTSLFQLRSRVELSPLTINDP
jgi:hypothetical protein